MTKSLRLNKSIIPHIIKIIKEANQMIATNKFEFKKLQRQLEIKTCCKKIFRISTI